MELMSVFMNLVKEFVKILIKLNAQYHQENTWNKGPSHGHAKSEKNEEENNWCLDETSHFP